MTLIERIQHLESEALRIEQNADNVIGGAKAYYSGERTYLKPAAQRKLDKINRELNALYDQYEA